MVANRIIFVIVSTFIARLFYCANRLVWSNFEIADMDFWRGEAYQRFFDFLDSKGGFYYEVNEFQHAQFPYTHCQDNHSDGETRLSIA